VTAAPGVHRPVPWLCVLAAAVAALAVGVWPAHAQDVGYTASLYVARGTYAGVQVTGVYFFNSVDVTHGRLRLSGSVPVIRERSTFAEATDGPAAAGADTVSGLGDPLIRLDVRLVDDRARGLQIGLAGALKPPLVGAGNGLGTGVADVAAGGSVFKAAGSTSLFADVLFWKYGDPEGVDYQDTWSYSVGVGRLIGRGRWSTLMSLAGFSHGIAGAAAPLQLNIAMLTLVGRRQSVAITAGFGLNDSSGDFSIGTSWRVAR
jgi:hypothetical protein